MSTIKKVYAVGKVATAQDVAQVNFSLAQLTEMINGGYLVPVVDADKPEVTFDIMNLNDAYKDIKGSMSKYYKDYKITHVSRQKVILGGIDEMVFITCIIKQKKSKGNLTNGYHLAYVYNETEPMFSEAGDVLVTKQPNGWFKRTY